MSNVVPPEELARRRIEREKQRRQREPFVGSILEALASETEEHVASEPMETRK